MDLKVSRNTLVAYTGLPLLLLMMVFISQLYLVKIVLMSFLLLLVHKKIELSINVFIAYSFILIYGFYGVFVGLINQTANPFLFFTIYCVWPLFYLLCSSYLKEESDYKYIIRVLFLGHVFIVLYDLVFAWGILAQVNIPNLYNVKNPFSIYENSTRMNFVNLNTLTFTTPVLFILFLGRYNFGISKLFQLLVLICTFFLFIISGRRSVMLVFLVLPLLPFFFAGFFSENIRKNIKRSFFLVLLTLFVLVFYVYKTNPQFIENYTQVFFNAFDSRKEPVKFAQKTMLIEKFIEKPLIGHGFGEIFYEPSPGRRIYSNQYELSYHLKLATTGLLGFFLIVGTYMGILLYGLYISNLKNDILCLAIIIGFFFMLIADATNPVLCSFDLIWPIYLCLARINYLELNYEIQKK